MQTLRLHPSIASYMLFWVFLIYKVHCKNINKCKQGSKLPGNHLYKEPKKKKKILDLKQQVFLSAGQLATSTSEAFSQSHCSTLPLNADSGQNACVWTSAPISSCRTLRKLHSSLYLSFMFWEWGLKLLTSQGCCEDEMS